MNAMRLLKKRGVWISVYAVVITGVFLYLLFPSETILRIVENTARQQGYLLKTGALRPSLPLGIGLTDVSVRQMAGSPGGILFQGEFLDLQINPVTLFRKMKTIRFEGRAWGGRFEGSAGFLSGAPADKPSEGQIRFKNIDLSRAGSGGISLLRGMSGQARGTVFYAGNDPAAGGTVGKLSLYISRGAYPLPEPFLGVSRIDFDRGEIQAQLKDGAVLLTRFEMHGAQVSCTLSGSILPADRVEDSRLNLKGVMELAGRNKIKMNVTVGGTLASPSFRYI